MMVNGYPTYLYSLRTLNVDDFILLLGRASIYKDAKYNIDKFIMILLFLSTYRVLDNNTHKQVINEPSLKHMLLINENDFLNEIQSYIITNPERMNFILSLIKIATKELGYIKDRLMTPNIYIYAIELFMKGINVRYVQ